MKKLIAIILIAGIMSNIAMAAEPGYARWIRCAASAGHASEAPMRQTESKMTSPTTGYIGVGAGLVGVSFMLNYFVNKVTAAQKFESLEVIPVFDIAQGGLYQGMNIAYKF